MHGHFEDEEADFESAKQFSRDCPTLNVSIDKKKVLTIKIKIILFNFLNI